MRIIIKRIILLLLLSLWFPPLAEAVTTINSTNKFSYGANIGWLDWRGDTNNGGVIAQYVCAGYLWAADVGWIHLGGGAPANGVQYQNNTSYDYGVNVDSQGNLRGYAYGANVGWISFETNGAPKVNLATGRLNGSIYSANCGWISLSNAIAFVQTGPIIINDSDNDGVPDAWELSYRPNLTSLSNSGDFDNDGISDLQEYVADTNPTNATSFLKILSNSVGLAGGMELDTLTWRSRPTRRYVIHSATEMFPGNPFAMVTDVLMPDAGTNTTRVLEFDQPATQRYFRVQALLPAP